MTPLSSFFSGAFLRPYRVLFRDCDPAGIAFFPRMVEWCNNHIEDCFHAHGFGFSALVQRGLIMPVVRLESQFSQPCFHGEELIFALSVQKIGTSSIDFCIAVYPAADTGQNCGKKKFEAKITSVCCQQGDPNAPPQSTPIPADIQQMLYKFSSAHSLPAD